MYCFFGLIWRMICSKLFIYVHFFPPLIGLILGLAWCTKEYIIVKPWAPHSPHLETNGWGTPKLLDMPMSSYEIHCGLAGEPTTDVWQYKKQYIVYRIYLPPSQVELQEADRLNMRNIISPVDRWKQPIRFVSWVHANSPGKPGDEPFFFWGGALWYLWMFVVFVCLWHGLGGPLPGYPSPEMAEIWWASLISHQKFTWSGGGCRNL